MADDRTLKELREELRASREVISVLQRRIERDHRRSGSPEVPVQRTIATLENTVDRRTRALLESEARYRALFDHSPYMALTIDAQGTITSVNTTALESLTSYPQLIDLELKTLFPEELRPKVEAVLRSTHDEVHELPLLDGKIVDLNVARLPGFPGAQVLLRDVSQRVALARELQNSLRLAAIGHLAAGVAHEINNPLTVLQLGLAELLGGLEEDAAAEVREFVAHCDRIANIVSNLHTFAEPRPPASETLLISDLLASAKDKARQSLGSIILMTSIESRQLSVYADRRQIQQVLVNLLSNAARAMGDHGHITISAESRDAQVVITISDEGPGISEERLQQIFTPFVGRDPAPGASFGSGLVLSMTWALLQENGGSLRATNRPEGGAIFEVTLPSVAPLERLDSEASTRLGAREPTAASRCLRILCVEDEEVLQRTLLRLLELKGHDPVGVGSAEEGLEQLAERSFDVVISDLRLPKMSGDKFAETVRARYPELRKRVLLMSGLIRDSKRNPNFLQKPFTSQQLNRALADLIAASPTQA